MKYASLYTLNTHRLRLAVDACMDRHYAVTDGVLFPETASMLADFCNRLDLKPCEQTPVYHRFDLGTFKDGNWPENLAWLVNATEAVVSARAKARVERGLMRWRVNEVAIQRYGGDPYENEPYAIDWHKDFPCDQHLVVVYSLCGAAQFEVETHTGVIRSFYLRRGAVALLAASDPCRDEDPRLRHRVSASLEYCPRISIALRMVADGGETNAQGD